MAGRGATPRGAARRPARPPQSRRPVFPLFSRALVAPAGPRLSGAFPTAAHTQRAPPPRCGQGGGGRAARSARLGESPGPEGLNPAGALCAQAVRPPQHPRFPPGARQASGGWGLGPDARAAGLSYLSFVLPPLPALSPSAARRGAARAPLRRPAPAAFSAVRAPFRAADAVLLLARCIN